MDSPKSSSFKWLLFDLDGTLLDFKSASKKAMWQTFEQYNKECTDELYKIYQKINHQVWTEFEQKIITAEELRPKRFDLFFKAINDEIAPPHIFNQQYLNNLVLCSDVYEGAIDLLQSLQGQYLMSVVTNGLKEVQRRRLARLNMTHFFDSIVVSDEIGFAKPNFKYFEYTYQSIPNPPPKSDILIIGDGIPSDILGGQNFGISTCWIRHGRINNSNIQPDYELEYAVELPSILK